MRQWNNAKRKLLLKLAAGVALTAAILYGTYWSLGSFDPAELFSNGVSWPLAMLAVLALVFATFVRSLAVSRGLDKELGIFDAFRITMVGNAANMVLPFKMGEGIRLMLFPSRYGAARRLRLTAVPGLVDTVVILGFCVSAVFFSGFHGGKTVRALVSLTVLLLALIVLGLLVLMLIPAANRAVRRFFDIRAWYMIFWVVFSWLFVYLAVWLSFVALHYNAAESFPLALATIGGMNVLTMLPTSPGGVGVFEYSIVCVLGALAIPHTPAKAVALLIHAALYAAIVPPGALLYFMGTGPVRRRFSGRVIRRA